MKSSILKKGEFDINALRKTRAAAKSKVDLVAGLAEISPEIERLKVGETCVIEGVTKADNRKVVMSITAKLSHLCAKGGDWAGRSFDVASDSDAGKVYVQRNSNLKPEDVQERKKGGGGGRRKKADTQTTQEAVEAVTQGATETVDAGGATVKEHA